MAPTARTRPAWCAGIPEPQVLPVGWEEGQRFTLQDDPDRTGESWEEPPFIAASSSDPTLDEARAGEVVREAVPFPATKGGQVWATYLHNVLSREECLEILEACNAKRFTPALVNVGNGAQMYLPDFRKGLRCVQDSKPLADLLLRRIRRHVPELIEGNGTQLRLVDVNERMRVLCYSERSDEFQPHFDGTFTRPDSSSESRITLQLYLNTIPNPGTEGGGTALLYTSTNPYLVGPLMGSVLLFTQNIYHSGEPLLTGGTKYTLRTELMYSPQASA